MMTSSIWNIFPRYLPFVRGIHRSPVNSPHKGQWHGTLIFSLICAWINDWVNNRKVGDLRRHRHFDVIVLLCAKYSCSQTFSLYLLPVESQIRTSSYYGVVGKYDRLIAMVTEKLHVPYLCDWMQGDRKYLYGILPHPAEVWSAFRDLVERFRWDNIGLLFEDIRGTLRCIEGLLLLTWINFDLSMDK